jgi:hypothetical protein
MFESESRLSFSVVGDNFQASKISIETGIFNEFNRQDQEVTAEFEQEGNSLITEDAGSLTYPVFFSSSPLAGDFGSGYSSQYEENRIDLSLTSFTPGINSFTLDNFSWAFDRKWTLESGDPAPSSIGWFSGMSLRFVDNTKTEVIYEADLAFFSFIVEDPDETETSFISPELYASADLVPFSSTSFFFIKDGEVGDELMTALNFEVDLDLEGDYTMYVAHYSDQFINIVPLPGAVFLFLSGFGALLLCRKFS